MTTKTCALPSCGTTFEAERADARYCSPTCRGKASRERRSAKAPQQHRPPPIPVPASPPLPESFDDFASRVLSLEERLENLEADLDLAETRQSTLTGLGTRLESLSRRLPSAVQVQEWSREVIREEIDAFRELLDDLDNRLAAMEIAEPGSDHAARTRIRRLEDRLAREINRSNALDQQVAVLAAGLRDLAGVVEERIGG